MDSGPSGKKDSKTYWMNLTLAGVAGQVGCFTLLIIIGAVFLGLWLDNHFQTRPVATLVLVAISVPISLGVMFFVVRQAVARIKTGPPPDRKDQ